MIIFENKIKSMKKLKNISKIYTGLAFFVLVLSLSSCLKNGNYFADFAAAAGSVDLPLAASNNNGVEAFSFDVTVTSTVLPIYANVASPSLPTKATTVVLALDTAYLTTYNTANNTNYELLPDSVYKISSLNMTIPAGKRLDSVNVSYDFTKLNLTHSYVLPITIASSSLPIEQWNHLLYYVSVKNKYDGKYLITGTMVDYYNSNLTGNYPWTAYLVTTGPNSVVLTDPTNGPVHLILNGTATSYYGKFGVVINFDPSGSGVINSVVNYYGQPASNTRSGQLDPSGINMRDPASKNIDISYFMLQPSVIPATPHIRTAFNENYKYLGPRP